MFPLVGIRTVDGLVGYIRRFDADHNGTIDRLEFEALWAELSKLEPGTPYRTVVTAPVVGEPVLLTTENFQSTFVELSGGANPTAGQQGDDNSDDEQLPLVVQRAQTPPRASRQDINGQWEQHVDNATGNSYWHNTVTDKTTWTDPTMAI